MRHCPPPPLSLTQLPLETMKQCDTLNMFHAIHFALWIRIKPLYCDRPHFSVK